MLSEADPFGTQDHTPESCNETNTLREMALHLYAKTFFSFQIRNYYSLLNSHSMVWLIFHSSSEVETESHDWLPRLTIDHVFYT